MFSFPLTTIKIIIIIIIPIRDVVHTTIPVNPTFYVPPSTAPTPSPFLEPAPNWQSGLLHFRSHS